MRNFLGAFGDGAILFPLLAALALQGGFNLSTLLGTAGVAYLVSAFLFRVPMSVQPLKSIVIAAIALGATGQEIRASGAVLGVLCLLLTFFDVNRLASRVPSTLVQGLQLGLGVLLMTQGLKVAATLPDDPLWILALSGLVAAMLFMAWRTSFPLFGIIAAAGLIYSVFPHETQALQPIIQPAPLRVSMVLTLVLPQLALTLANSVVGTRDVAQRYFGNQATRVTIRRLLQSIGFGNVLSAIVGGIPFCHGSGGVTAHVRAGASHWISNVVIGATLLGFSLMQPSGLDYPRPLMAGLLFVVGIFHASLARPALSGHVLQMVLMAGAAFWTQDMLYVLAVGVGAECLKVLLRNKKQSHEYSS